MNFLIPFHSIFQDEESLGREEEVEHVGWEDLEVAWLEETSDGGWDFKEEDVEEKDEE
jgi:hypothetical protein